MSSEIETASRFSPRRAKLFDLGFKLGDGLFEIEIAAHQTLCKKRKTGADRGSPAGRADTGDSGPVKSR